MTVRTKISVGGAERPNELIFSRVFDASADTVYRAWTDPERLVKWWGPREFSLTIKRMDVKVGGVWEYTLHGPDGTDYPNRAVFEFVDPPRRLVFRNEGGHISDKHLTCRMAVTFETLGEGTLVTLGMQFVSATTLSRAIERGVKEGGQESFERLAELLAETY